MEAVAPSIAIAVPERSAFDRWRWRVFAATWVAYAGTYLTRKSLSVAKIGIAQDPSMGISGDLIGLVDGGFLTAYMLGMFLWGPVADRFGARRVVTAGLIGSVLAAIASGLAPGFWMLMLAAVVHGFCQSTGWAPLNKVMSQWFSRRERGVVMGWWCTSYAIGGLIASPFAGLMAGPDFFGNWRFAFFIPAIALAGVAGLFAWLSRDRPEDVGLPPIEHYAGEKEAAPPIGGAVGPSRWTAMREVLRNPVVWTIGLAYFFVKPTRYAILFWSPKYLHETLGSDVVGSAALSAMFELGGPLGVLGMGYISDKLLGSRRFPVLVCCLALLAPVLYFFDGFVTSGAFSAGIALFAIGLLVYGPDALMSSTTAIDFGTKRGAATATGFINGMGSLGAILGGSLPGFVAARWGWDGVFTTLAFITLLAAAVFVPLWNRVPDEG